MKFPLLLSTIAILGFLACQPTEETTEPEPMKDYTQESEEAFDERMEWWRDATFGMFIHWGLYAIPAGEYDGEEIAGIGEWIMERADIPVEEYEKYAAQFNPVDFDADEWAQIAADAGMKYMIITSKHHDGFCLWDSEVTEYDIIDATPYDRDILAELKTACDEHGVKLGFYHSIMDWHHPNAQAPAYPEYNYRDSSKINPNFDDYVENYLKPQVKELVEKYDPYVLWFDGEWIPDWTHEHGVEMYNYIRNMKPDIIINNRVDKGRQGMQGMNAGDQDYAGDFGTPEQEILESTSDFDWESCMTMNDTWGFKTNDDNWKSTETLIHNIIDIAAKGGNYLLNVGPTANGEIPEPSVERLAAIGDWLEVNGEAIYATERLRQFKEGETIYYTQSKQGDIIYAISTAWPGEELRLEQVSAPDDAEIILYGHDDEPLEWTKDGEALVIQMPADWQDAANRTVEHAFAFRIPGGTEVTMQ